MPKRTTARRKATGGTTGTAQAEEATPTPESDTEADADASVGEEGQSGVAEILPLFLKDDGWYIDSSELSPDCPEWGPYGTKAEANEDRRPSFRRRVREIRRQKRALTKGQQTV